jgi:hypothetical protein
VGNIQPCPLHLHMDAYTIASEDASA